MEIITQLHGDSKYIITSKEVSMIGMPLSFLCNGEAIAVGKVIKVNSIEKGTVTIKIFPEYVNMIKKQISDNTLFTIKKENDNEYNTMF